MILMGMKTNPLTRASAAAAAVLLAVALAGCSGTPSLVGNWEADDGTSTKVINEQGQCLGMFYNGSAPLDIGGGMTCSLSTAKGSDGRYSLVVSQPPNKATYAVEFESKDVATVFSSSGARLYSMSRL
jgi:uncharacterized protein (DUF2147 family)